MYSSNKLVNGRYLHKLLDSVTVLNSSLLVIYGGFVVDNACIYVLSCLLSYLVRLISVLDTSTVVCIATVSHCSAYFV